MTPTTIPTPGVTARDAHPIPLSPAQRLAQDAARAAEVRAYQTDPDVVALRVDRIRGQVEALMWTGIGLGLCFTMTNVQHFAAAGAALGSLAWWAAWWLDPMVSLVLLAVLRAEQLTTRYQVNTGPWPRIAKWVLLTANYVMNTWAFWAAGSASGVVLHSVPSLVVVIAAEALTELQYALTTCAQYAAHRPAEPPTPTTPPLEHPHSLREHPPTPPHERSVAEVGERPASRRGGATNPNHRDSPPQAGSSRRAPTPESLPPLARKLFADYLAQARAAWTPGVVVTPAWVRQVTGCSRGLSSRLATTLRADLPTTETEYEGRAAS